MKVLISGATGLIGQAVVKILLDKDISVHYLTTRKAKIEERPSYKGFYWNPEQNKIDHDAFEGVSAIIHLAGATVSKRWTKAYKEEILQSRIQPTDLIYKSLQKIDHGIKHIISASGISIYPNSHTKYYSEEDGAVDSSFLSEVVYDWESSVNKFKDLGMEVSIIRTGIVLSKLGGALPKMLQPIKLGMGAALGSGEQWQSWIHIEDIASIYSFVLTNKLSGVFNAVAPNPVTNKRLTKTIASISKSTLWMPNVPSFLLKVLLGEMSAIVLEGQLVSSKKIEGKGYSFKYPNLELALTDLL